MRKIVIAMAAIALSSAPAHAQFETFFGSNGFAGFNGSTANAGCLSGASGMGLMGRGATTCESAAGGNYAHRDFAQQQGTFDGQITGGYSNNSAATYGISSVWNANGGPKTGSNSIVGGSNNASAAGIQFQGNTWGSFNQFTDSQFAGTSSVHTTSWFTLGGGAD